MADATAGNEAEMSRGLDSGYGNSRHPPTQEIKYDATGGGWLEVAVPELTLYLPT